MIAKSWKLPQEITAAIGYHHSFSELLAHNERVNEVVVSLVALLKMAEHTSREFRGLAFRSDVQDREWETLSAMALSHFDLDEDDFQDLMQRTIPELGQR